MVPWAASRSFASHFRRRSQQALAMPSRSELVGSAWQSDCPCPHIAAFAPQETGLTARGRTDWLGLKARMDSPPAPAQARPDEQARPRARQPPRQPP